MSRSALKNAALYYPDFTKIIPKDFDLTGQRFTYQYWTDLRIPLAGSYQMQNAAVVLEAVKVLRPMLIS